MSNNVIQIKHGASAPGNGVLEPYELGYAKVGGLFIGGEDGEAISVASETAKFATQLETAQAIQVNLESPDAAQFDGTAGIEPGIKGILSIANGGTGATTAEDARANLGITAANLGVAAHVDEENKILYITTHN